MPGISTFTKDELVERWVQQSRADDAQMQKLERALQDIVDLEYEIDETDLMPDSPLHIVLSIAKRALNEG